MRYFAALLIVLFAFPVYAAGNETNDSYGKAKKMLRQIYADHRVTVYCEASYDAENNIDLPAGFQTSAHPKRSGKIEWEHAAPAENFGRAFREWREGDPQCVHKGRPFKGRRCAEKTNGDFRLMQADMHNLFPAIGSVNASRGNRQYAELPFQRAAFGSCEAKYAGNKFEPPDQAKGEVARASLYMADSYKIFNLSKQQRQLFEAWDKRFPVTPWECERNRRIAKAQGNDNPRVTAPCRKAGL
ncbi:MAG: endonuclease [Desulfovibrio sp.]|nr:endonuclease [Desulfovibrio sp.]